MIYIPLYGGIGDIHTPFMVELVIYIPLYGMVELVIYIPLYGGIVEIHTPLWWNW